MGQNAAVQHPRAAVIVLPWMSQKEPERSGFRRVLFGSGRDDERLGATRFGLGAIICFVGGIGTAVTRKLGRRPAGRSRRLDGAGDHQKGARPLLVTSRDGN